MELAAERKTKLTRRADIVQDGVRPDFRIDGFDKGGHCDGGAALRCLVAVTVDGLMVELRDRRPGRLGKKVWGPVRTDLQSLPLLQMVPANNTAW